MICAGFREYLFPSSSRLSLTMCSNVQKTIVYKHPMHSSGYVAEQRCTKDSSDQCSINRRNQAKWLLSFDLQSALNPCKMLFPRPMSLGPNVSHSLPYMSDVNNLQTFLHLLRQIFDVFPVVVW